MDERLKTILNHYGDKVERLKCCEECAELIQALLKGDSVSIAQEIADVEITIEYMKESFVIRDAVEKFKEMKIQRQLRRIENER